MNGRERKFLRAPTQAELWELTGGTHELVIEAEAALQNFRSTHRTPWENRELISLEARASAGIEDEYDEERIAAHASALEKFLEGPRGETSLLRLHREMMQGQQHALPGRYRTFNVAIGYHTPPEHTRVHGADGRAVQLTPGITFPRLTRSIWTHVQFETIHPFGDGNGRTGRAMLLLGLDAVLPISRFILREQQEYYQLFQESDWSRWLNWLCRGILEEHESLSAEKSRQKRTEERE